MEEYEDLETQKISKEEVWNVLEFMNALYKESMSIPTDYFYNTSQENKILVDLNNNAKIPTRESLRKALADYKNQAENLQDYSEFFEIWDSIYNRTIDYFANLLAFDINSTVINADTNDDFNSEEYKSDKKRVDIFLENFNAKQEFRNVVKNVLKTDTYYCWLRETKGKDEIIDIKSDNPKSYSLQMMPQNQCKITGKFTGKGINGFLWDFNLNYFNNANVNISNYDSSLVKSFGKIHKNSQKNNDSKIKSYIIDNNLDLNKDINNYLSDNYVRTKVEKGAWLFKYNFDNFNTIPPFAFLMKSVFDDDLIESLQRDKDIISANAIILGEMKTRDKEVGGNNKNAFTIDPTQIGRLLQLARKGLNKNIKQIALPLEETRLYQFADNNSNMYNNKLKTSAGLGAHNSSLIYTNEKLSQEEAQLASSIDFNSIANVLYPQFENFLNYFVNKKTDKYKFKFSVTGSTLPFLRKNDIDNYIKLSDKGIQVPIRKWGTLLGQDGKQFEQMVKEAKYEGTQDLLFSLLNANTNVNEIGAPTKDNSELSDGGAISREYR